LTGAAVGGLLLGGVGAVIGGLSGSKRSVALCRLIELRITVNSTANPTHVVCFQNTELKTSNPMYSHNADIARTWQAKVAVLIRRGERLTGASVAAIAPHLVGQALTQLVDLRDKGALTPQEFDQQKARLLAQPASPSSSAIEEFEPPPPEQPAVLSSRSLPPPPEPHKAPMSAERKAELMAKARALAAERHNSSLTGEHRLDTD
jgi:hypothetical protein